MAKEKRSVADLDAELAALEEELAALEGRKPAPRKATPAAPKPAPVPEPEAREAPPEPAAEKKARFGFGKRKATEEAAPQYAAEQGPAPAELAPASEKKRFGFGKKKAEEAPQEEIPAPAAPGKSRLAMPSFGRKQAAEPAPSAPPVEPAPEPEGSLHYAEPLPARAPEPAKAASSGVPVTDGSVWRQEEGAWVRVVADRPRARVRRILDEEENVVREEPVSERDLRDEGPAEAPEEKPKANLGRLFRRKG